MAATTKHGSLAPVCLHRGRLQRTQPRRPATAPAIRSESAAHLQGVEAGLLGGRSRGQLGHWFSEYSVAAIMA